MGIENPTLLFQSEQFANSNSSYLSQHKSPAESTEDTNTRGLITEQKVAQLLQRLPYVLEVIQTKKFSKEDLDMVDLIVIFKPDQPQTVVREVLVQIKSSRKGVKHFVQSMSQKLEIQGNEKRAQLMEWLAKNRRIILNGDIQISRSGRSRRKLSDEEIIADFESQLAKIMTSN